jgi:hypothetical protein
VEGGDWEGRSEGDPNCDEQFGFDWRAKQEAVDRAPREAGRTGTAQPGGAVNDRDHAHLPLDGCVGLAEYNHWTGRCRGELMGLSRNGSLSSLARRPPPRELRG